MVYAQNTQPLISLCCSYLHYILTGYCPLKETGQTHNRVSGADARFWTEHAEVKTAIEKSPA